MKEINLLSITQASKRLSKLVLKSYFQHFGTSAKETELNDLDLFVRQMKVSTPNIEVLDGYFLGYTIPQISKEFDLLRFGNKYIVNIELKSENTGVKIFKQLIKNHYYLSFLKKEIYCYTYVSSENQIYSLNRDKTLRTVSFDELYDILENQNVIPIDDINKLFKPSNYLVSPFNSTDEFIDGKYFLTSRQDEIKQDCIGRIEKKGAAFISICGKAGTGKSLLAFDIAKEFIVKKQKVLIVHCGLLNNGHRRMNEQYGWNIIAAKSLLTTDLSVYDLVVLDECQRIYPSQLKIVINQIKAINGNCIFSYDRQQCLRQWEINNDIANMIVEMTSSILFELTEKIRTNKEIASFIIALFDKGKAIEKLNRQNVELSYFDSNRDAKKFIKLLGEYGWKIINYTPSNRDKHPYDEYGILNEDNAHEVIGQEFDKVVAVIDQSYIYDGNNLTVKYSKLAYYHPVKMLFQIMTRTRIKLHVVVIDNEEILARCISILGSE